MLQEAFAIEEIPSSLKEIQQHRGNLLGDLSRTMSPSTFRISDAEVLPMPLVLDQAWPVPMEGKCAAILSTPAGQGRKCDSTQLLGGASLPPKGGSARDVNNVS